MNKRDALFASLWLLSVEGGKLPVSVNKLKTFLKMGVQNRDFMDIGEEHFLTKVDFYHFSVLLDEKTTEFCNQIVNLLPRGVNFGDFLSY